MDDSTARDQIAQLEIRIEALSESIARCRKIALGAKIAAGAGAAWFLVALLWILPFDVTGFVAATTALLGGFVLLGSNATTWAQTELDLHNAEAMRTDLIASIELRVVGERTPTIH
jgi:hypothetical protein